MLFYPAPIALPRFDKIDQDKWGVIACDQYTSNPAYWEALDREIGTSPSTLRLILPEVFLEQEDTQLRITQIWAAMKAYKQEVFQIYEPSYVYIERTQPDGRVRCGLVGMIDLEDYDFSPTATTPIRATEATVTDRLPPRMKVREGADYELPHVMLLTDDEEDTLLAPYAEGRGLLPLYDITLIAGGGHLRGWLVPKEESERINAKFKRKDSTKHPLYLAVGDGNHSLASAKAIYENEKANRPDSAKTSPLRYALCEVVNLHSPALTFEPIFRLAKETKPYALTEAFISYLRENENKEEYKAMPSQTFHLVHEEGVCEVVCMHGTHPLAVGTVQHFLDTHTHLFSGLDYIHDEEDLRALAKKPLSLGFLFDGMSKHELFSAVSQSGSLPRKTFSMGHAKDKRYYMEARQIKA